MVKLIPFCLLVSWFQLYYVVLRSTIDDEYANAVDRDPKILLTTSRNPNAPLTQFVKELKFIFPNAQRMNPGAQSLDDAASVDAVMTTSIASTFFSQWWIWGVV
ncbi:unnamed protein product [Fraxinus pennsylvanica]|uniref:Brix domain-containing protein n=1 Tax=Fraxinus pennsylvanica TaxID=56036 RepID=A0AAD2DYD1_9LAMI|nr:unnamed protein product [Fraxinus pennsylvanica]